jgi:hypothetical protein
VLTRSATRARVVDGVYSRAELARLGFTTGDIRRQREAGRWRTLGRAVVTHCGPLTRAQVRTSVLLNCGPRSVLTSFTAAEMAGLTGWLRDEIHVLAPAGTARPEPFGVGFRLHRIGTWPEQDVVRNTRTHRIAPALVLAAASFPIPRPACGILAAAVQQRITTPDALRAALLRASRTRHRGVLLHAVGDIAMGAEALSEIDLVALCRRHRLPTPTLQAVRREPGGRRRYLDAEWTLSDGRRVAAEVDGGVHFDWRNWTADQLRQNEVVLGGTLVLRIPSVALRTDEARVIAQLRRALLGP